MKGIIFNLVEEAITAEHGERGWDDLLEASGLDGVYTSLGNYADTDLQTLLQEGARMLHSTPGDLARSLGHESSLGLARRFPHYFTPYADSRTFLLTLGSVIHPEVRKIHPDTQPPEFWFNDADARVLEINYRSQRRLCAFAEGMIAGAATYYGQRVQLDHQSCMLDGEDHCVLDATFEPR